MNKQDAEALPWMADSSGSPATRVVWQQDDVAHGGSTGASARRRPLKDRAKDRGHREGSDHRARGGSPARVAAAVVGPAARPGSTLRVVTQGRELFSEGDPHARPSEPRSPNGPTCRPRPRRWWRSLWNPQGSVPDLDNCSWVHLRQAVRSKCHEQRQQDQILGPGNPRSTEEVGGLQHALPRGLTVAVTVQS